MDLPEPVTVNVAIRVSAGVGDDPAVIRAAVRDWLAAARGLPLPTRETSVVMGVCVSEPRDEFAERLAALANETGWSVGFFKPPEPETV